LIQSEQHAYLQQIKVIHRYPIAIISEYIATTVHIFQLTCQNQQIEDGLVLPRISTLKSLNF